LVPLIRDQTVFVKAKLLRISPSAIDQVLKEDRKKPALMEKNGTNRENA
jgi:predicted transcriptional regulator